MRSSGSHFGQIFWEDALGRGSEKAFWDGLGGKIFWKVFWGRIFGKALWDGKIWVGDSGRCFGKGLWKSILGRFYEKVFQEDALG